MPNCLSYAIGTEITTAIKQGLRQNREWRNYVLNMRTVTSPFTVTKVNQVVNSWPCDNDEVGKAIGIIINDPNYNLNVSGSQSLDVLGTKKAHALSIINTVRNTGRSIPPFQIANWTAYSQGCQFPNPGTDLRYIFMGTYAGAPPNNIHYFTNQGDGHEGVWYGIPSLADTTPSPVTITGNNQICQQTTTDGGNNDVTITGWFS